VLFYGNKIYTNVPSSIFICTLTVLFSFVLCSQTGTHWALNDNIKDSLVTTGNWHKAAKFSSSCEFYYFVVFRRSCSTGIMKMESVAGESKRSNLSAKEACVSRQRTGKGRKE
jgi:hypothetical protein